MPSITVTALVEAGLFWPRARLTLLVVGLVAVTTQSRGQSPPGSDLYSQVLERDRRLFEQGFKGHDIAPFHELISDHFEFYHDTAGLTPSKAAFVSDIQNKDIYAEMITPVVEMKTNRFMGLGWQIYTGLGDGELALAHSGSDQGVKTLVIYLLHSREGLIIFTNSDNGWKIYSELVRAFLKQKGQRIVEIENPVALPSAGSKK